jgi:hypothetical protein
MLMEPASKVSVPLVAMTRSWVKAPLNVFVPDAVPANAFVPSAIVDEATQMFPETFNKTRAPE